MTLLQAIQEVDAALDIPCAYEQKVACLSRLDAYLHRRLLMPGPAPRYDADTDPATPLLAGEAFGELYPACLRRFLLEQAGDTAGADRAKTQRDALVEAFAAAYRRQNAAQGAKILYPGRRGW